MSRKRRLLRISLVASLFLVPLVCLLCGCISLDRPFVFFPSPYPRGDWEPAGLEFEDVWFQASDGTQLHGWYSAASNPREVVLHTHGNAGNVTHRADVLCLFRARLRTSILVFDYRGYGRSEGTPTEAGILDDARAARQWLARRTGVAETAVVLHGTSLGGAVAVDLAARDGARALILENTFSSVPEVASAKAPFLPVRLLLKTRLDSGAKIGLFRGPLLQMHGESDRTIPYFQGRKLFDRANEPKQFLSIPDADHNDPPTAEYVQVLERFLSTLPARKAKRQEND